MLTRAQIKRRLKKGVALFLRIPLKNKEFSILSNNCWGGVVYDRYALPYRTPTIGLWIPPEDYIKLLKNPKFYFNSEIKQINYRESHVADLLIERKKSGRYDFHLDDLIIGRVVDVDIVFIHYKTFDDYIKKSAIPSLLGISSDKYRLITQNSITEEKTQKYSETPLEKRPPTCIRY